MKYKMICIDMDGTLLNSKRRISQGSKESIKKAHDLGVEIVINTGRIYVDAENYSNLIGVKSPVIASNGAIVKDKNTGDIIYKSIVKEEVAKSILELCKKHKVKPIMFAKDNVYYSGFLYGFIWNIAKILGAVYKCINYKKVNNWDKVIEEETGDIVKFEVILLDEKKLGDLKKELMKIGKLKVTSSSKYNIEITGEGATKGKAVEALAKKLNIDREEVITVGDSENDISMFEYAGLSIAMGNARDIVQKKADYVTSSNDEDGVAKAIDKFILN